MRVDGDRLIAEPCQTAIKGWKVSATRAVDKGCLVGRATPLLVHQTLANREEVLVCAHCHRFVGTEATQLAMLHGLHGGDPVCRGSDTTKRSVVENTTTSGADGRKRPRVEGYNRHDGGGAGIESRMSRAVSGGNGQSWRLVVAHASPADLPFLPRLRGEEVPNKSYHDGDGDSDYNGNGADDGADDVDDGQGSHLPPSPAVPTEEVPTQISGPHLVGTTRALDGTAANGASLNTISGHGDGRGGGRAVVGRRREEGRKVYSCDAGAPCDDVYCSARCRREAREAGHGLICVGAKGEGSPLFEFRQYAIRTNETYLIAAVAVAAALSSAEGTRPLEALAGWNDPLPVERQPDDSFAAAGGGIGGEMRGIDGGIGIPLEEAQEAWSLLSAGMAMAYANRAAASEGGLKACIERARTLEFFLRTVRALGRHLAPIAVPSPLVRYCTRLALTTDEDAKLRALLWLSPAIERACQNDGAPEETMANTVAGALMPVRLGTLSGSATSDGGRDSKGTGWIETGGQGTGRGSGTRRRKRSHGGDDGLEPALGENYTRMIAVERGLCRLAQAAASAVTEASDAPSLFPSLSVVGILPPCCSPEHSCVPNVQLEATLREEKEGEDPAAFIAAPAAHGGDPVGRVVSALLVGLITLRGVSAGERLSAPYVALGQSVEERRRELASRLGLRGGDLPSPRASCECPRCLLEAEGDQSCGGEMLKILADQALEEGRHDAALGLYRSALATLRPSLSSPPPSPMYRAYSEALYGVGVALLAGGRFQAARSAWKRGFREAPLYPALRVQAQKEAAYRPVGAPNKEEVQGGQCCGYDSFASTPGAPADIFMSEAPVLTREECAGVIRAARAYAEANGGWTTSRHYAVPTTDLPMHSLVEILPWFRALLSERLFPMLAGHFGLSGGARSVAVLDAFVVRYEEGKQRHLPLHRDQSTHSFTIALNGLDEYSGGGTFFPCLGRALRPPEGHALAFRGGVLHGGDPLVKGVRYIIACFCYYDQEEQEVADLAGEVTDNDACDRDRHVNGAISIGSEAREGGRGVVGGGAAHPSGKYGGRGGSGDTSASVDEARSGKTRKGIEFSNSEAFSFSFSFG